MSEPAISESEFSKLRNRLFLRVMVLTAPGGSVAAYLLCVATDLSRSEIVNALLVALPVIYVVIAGGFGLFMISTLLDRALHPPEGEEASRLRRLLELPRKIEVYFYTMGWAMAGTSFAVYCCARFGRSYGFVALGLAVGVFAGLFLGPILTNQLEGDLRELAIREYHRDPSVELGGSGGIFWVRQRWYLPYAFALALVSLFLFCGVLLTAQLRELAAQIAEALREGRLAGTTEAVARELSPLVWSAGIPLVGIACILLVAFGVLGTMLARRQSMSAAAVERSLRAIAAGNPELPRWIASDESGDLARATGRVSAELQSIFVQLRAMAGGDLGQELRGESGLVAAFRESQSAMLQLARMMTALSRGDVSGDGRIPGDLGAHFDQLRSAFRATVEQAQTIAQGDLRREVDVPGSLGQAIQQMTSNLRAMVGQTQTVSADVGDIVVSLQSAVNQLSAAAAEQVAAVTETANTTTEMAQTSALAADRASELIHQGEEATAAVDEGLQASQSAVQAMNAIAESLGKVSEASSALTERARRIDGITETVGFLADQSSTLAINAAIEAARAGDAGKGFAVVAREIRALANDSRKAAAQIREILGEILERTTQVDGTVAAGTRTVDDGGEQVKRVEKVVNQLGVTVQDAVALMRQVEGSARQHQVGVSQISQALTNLQKASESIRDGAKLLGSMSTRAHDLSTALQKASGAYSLPTRA